MHRPDVIFLRLLRETDGSTGNGSSSGRNAVHRIEAERFPHREKSLKVFAVIQVPQGFDGEISGRIVGAETDFRRLHIRSGDAPQSWVFDQVLGPVTFPSAGVYALEMTADGVPFYWASMIVNYHEEASAEKIS